MLVERKKPTIANCKNFFITLGTELAGNLFVLHAFTEPDSI